MFPRVVEYPNSLNEHSSMPLLTFENSGGLGRASSHESMVNNHHHTTPQVNYTPSTHPVLALHQDGQHAIFEDDLLFTLNDVKLAGATRSSNSYYYSRNETALASLPKLNALILKAAMSDLRLHPAETAACATGRLESGKRARFGDFVPGLPVPALTESQGFWQSPQMVSEWATPIGVANMPYEMPGSHNSPACKFVPTRVARRVTTKHIFRSVGAKCSEWVAQGTMQLALQYAIEEIQLDDGGPLYPIVVVSGLLMDDPRIARQMRGLTTPNGRMDPENHCGRTTPLLFIHDSDDTYHPTDDSVREWQMNPIGNHDTAVIVHLGRVLHTCLQSPTAHENLRALCKKSIYDVMPRLHFYLGCR